jgi:predicted methyltransferase
MGLAESSDNQLLGFLSVVQQSRPVNRVKATLNRKFFRAMKHTGVSSVSKHQNAPTLPEPDALARVGV